MPERTHVPRRPCCQINWDDFLCIALDSTWKSFQHPFPQMHATLVTTTAWVSFQLFTSTWVHSRCLTEMRPRRILFSSAAGTHGARLVSAHLSLDNTRPKWGCKLATPTVPRSVNLGKTLSEVVYFRLCSVLQAFTLRCDWTCRHQSDLPFCNSNHCIKMSMFWHIIVFPVVKCMLSVVKKKYIFNFVTDIFQSL